METSDNKTPKNKRRYNLRKRKNKKNYKLPHNSDDSDSDYDPDNYTSDESEESFDKEEYTRLLGKMFPSKYMKEKTKSLKKKKKKQVKKKKKKKKKKKEEEQEEVQEEEEETIESFDSFIDDDDEEIDEKELQSMLKGNNAKLNIIFTVGGQAMMGEEMDESDYDAEDEDEEEEEETKNQEKWKRGDIVEVKLSDWDEYWQGTIVKVNDNGTYKVKLKDEGNWDKIKPKYIRSITKEAETTLDEVKLLIKEKKKGGNKALLEKFNQMAKSLQKKRSKEKKISETDLKNENLKDFRKLLKEKNIQNDFTFFKGLKFSEQEKILEKLKEIQNYTKTDKPYRLSIIESDIPVQYKSSALRKLNSLSYMDPGSGEYYKLKLWVDTFMRIPFSKYNNLPLTIDSGKEKCNQFMENAKNILDKAVYGMEDAKMQILQVLGQLISNPSSVGTAIALKGPPGTGKTTLIKEGVSKILERPFAFLALGGATDSSFLEGHSYTYEGSVWGKVVDILITSKCMNPIIYFDELDKISETPKGEEITGILTHLTDTTQNDKFHDKYFSNIDFNLSKILFIFSYNDEKKVNPILKDRMYRIETKGYDKKQKVIIARDYLINKIEKNVNFEKGQIIISDTALEHIIDHYTENEKGVRNLKRCLEIIYTKLNLHRLMKPDSSLFEKEKVLKVEFPFEVKKEAIDKLIKNTNNSNIPFGLYM